MHADQLSTGCSSPGLRPDRKTVSRTTVTSTTIVSWIRRGGSSTKPCSSRPRWRSGSRRTPASSPHARQTRSSARQQQRHAELHVRQQRDRAIVQRAARPGCRLALGLLALLRGLLTLLFVFVPRDQLIRIEWRGATLVMRTYSRENFSFRSRSVKRLISRSPSPTGRPAALRLSSSLPTLGLKSPSLSAGTGHLAREGQTHFPVRGSLDSACRGRAASRCR